GKAVFTIQSKDYIKLLTSMRTIVIEAVVLLEKQIYNVMQHISLKTSELEILVPKAVDYNSKFNLTVKFKNPLNQTLRNLRITVEGNGIKRKVVKLSDLTAYETENVTIQLKSKYYGLETIVITLYSDILKEIVGHVQLQVKGRKRH
ncbi:protein-glutamine gamma-glutamyltransferase E-like isoform X1, partial [Leptotrombidium deliense]